jgi:hypothetical protein
VSFCKIRFLAVIPAISKPVQALIRALATIAHSHDLRRDANPPYPRIDRNSPVTPFTSRRRSGGHRMI